MNLLPLLALLAQTQFAGLKPAPATSTEAKITVDATTEIPLTVIRGAKPGPTLAILAGLSGTDYSPITAAQHLANSLNPAELSGTLVIVLVANIPAFLDRSIYSTLLHTFPGKPDGTTTEKLAHALTTQILAKADAVVILQAGGANTMLAPHVFQFTTGDPKQDAKMAAMAMAFGINYIVTAKPSAASPEAVVLAHAKPVIKVVCGSFGMTDTRTVDSMTKGSLAMLNMFEMIKDNPGRTRSPVFFDRLTTVESPRTGQLSAYIQRGQDVHKGDPIFGVSGYNGKNPQIITAPVDGIMISIVATLPVNKSETIAVIGTPRIP